MNRANESRKAARILRKILEFNPVIPGVMSRDRKEALELAISLLEARGFDGDEDR